jgi:four helix bundle protein
VVTISRFEDVEAWKRARDLTRLIYRVSGQGGFARDFALRDQIRRAAVSVLSNIAEGFERGGNREFRQFLSQAKGSVGEVRAQLYVALDAELLTQDQFDELCALATRTGQLIAGLIRYLEQSNLNGAKYR